MTPHRFYPNSLTLFSFTVRYRDVDPLTGEFGKSHFEAAANYFYNDVDAAEDLVLFPEEAAGYTKKAITGSGVASAIAFLDNEVPNMKRFVGFTGSLPELSMRHANSHACVSGVGSRQR